MNAINRTRIAAQVNAAFTLHLSSGETLHDFLVDHAQPSLYVYGLFPEQDMRVLTSVYYTLLNELIGLQVVSDKPLQDRPQEGSLEANDNGVGDSLQAEREFAQAQVMRDLAAVERHLFSCQEYARKMSEEAGRKTEDGGRIRFNRKTNGWVMPVPDFDEALKDALARATPHSQWAAKIALVQETVSLPIMSETRAQEIVSELLQDNTSLDKIASKTWTAVMDLMAECGQELTRHDKVMADLNLEMSRLSDEYVGQELRAKLEVVKTRMAQATSRHRENLNYPKWLLERKLEAVQLLAHSGTPKALLESPEWLTKEAEVATAKAHADLAMAQAKTAQMNANLLLMEANAALMEQQKVMADMMARINQRTKELMGTPEPKAEKKAKQAKTKLEEPEAKEKIKAKGPNIISGRGSVLQSMFRRS